MAIGSIRFGNDRRAGKLRKTGRFCLWRPRHKHKTGAGYADLPGVRIWYTVSGGNGVPVVLLHADTGNGDSWQYNIPGFVEAGWKP